MDRAPVSIFSVGDGGIRLLNALGEAVIATDAQGRIVVWNDSASRLYGYSENEARGRSIYEVTVPHIGDAQAREIMRTLNDGQSWTGEFLVRDRAGRTFLAEVTDVPMLGPNGQLEMIIGISRDIDSRKGAEAERERLIAELNLAASAKDDFLTLVSHELRTPLTTILGMAQVLIRHGHLLDGETTQDALTDISNYAHRMTRLVEDLLTLSRKSANSQLELEPIASDHTVNEVIREHHRYSQSKRVIVGNVGPCPPVLGHQLLFEHVLLNLLSNAEKYSPQDTTIEVICEQSGQEVVTRVLDRGSGISEEDLPHVFEEFYRAEATRHLPGAGLGLPVCKRLMDLQGGRVWLEPRAGGGTIATLALRTAD